MVLASFLIKILSEIRASFTLTMTSQNYFTVSNKAKTDFCLPPCHPRSPNSLTWHLWPFPIWNLRFIASKNTPLDKNLRTFGTLPYFSPFCFGFGGTSTIQHGVRLSEAKLCQNHCRLVSTDARIRRSCLWISHSLRSQLTRFLEIFKI